MNTYKIMYKAGGYPSPTYEGEIEILASNEGLAYENAYNLLRKDFYGLYVEILSVTELN